MNPPTMRVRAQYSWLRLTILIDSGSTHNFLHERVAQAIRIPTEHKTTMTVMVTERLNEENKYKTNIYVKKERIKAYIYKREKR